MNKQDVIQFFDRLATQWDADLIKSDTIINTILDNAEVGPGQDILDVACGTGVMFPYYLERGAASVTGIDISSEMAKIAEGKFAQNPNVRVIWGDVEEFPFEGKFDRIVVYNAFPHFPEPRRLIRTLAGLLKEGGRLTIAHGMSREAIDNHHSGAASKVSNGLMTADSLKTLCEPVLDVEVVISNRRMYQVSGVKRSEKAVPKVPGGAAMEELLALMKFMVAHNDAHAQELAGMADQLRQAGKTRAYDRIMDAVADFDIANAQLDAVVKELQLDEE